MHPIVYAVPLPVQVFSIVNKLISNAKHILSAFVTLWLSLQSEAMQSTGLLKRTSFLKILKKLLPLVVYKKRKPA